MSSFKKKKPKSAFPKKIHSSPHSKTNKAFSRNSKIKHFPILAIVLTAIVSGLLYFKTIEAEFHFDDFSYVVNMPNMEFGLNIQDMEGTFNKLWKEFYLPGKRLFYLTLALNYHFRQLEPASYRQVNILIHVLNGCLVFFLIRILMREWLIKEERGQNYYEYLALALAMVFIAHPLAVNSVTYITQRTGALATLFYQAAFMAYLQFKKEQQAKKWIWLGGGICLFWAASQSKSMAITFPLIVLSYELIDNIQNPQIFWRWVKITMVGAVVFLGAVLAYAYKIQMFSPHSLDVGFNSPGLWSPWIHFLTELRVFVHYWILLFFPWPGWLSINHEFVLSQSIGEVRTLGALFFHLVLIMGAGWLIKKGYRLMGFGIFWFYLTLSPPYLVLPQQELFVEYKTYLPSIGWLMVLGEGMFWLRSRIHKALQMGGMLMILILLAGVTLHRNEIYQNNISLWGDVLKKYPQSTRAYNNQAKAFVSQKRYKEALANFDAAIKADPGYMEGYNNRGNVYFQLGQYQPALKDYNQTIKLLKTFPETIQSKYQYALVFFQRGQTHLKLKNYEEAIQDFDQFLRWHPQDALSYFNRARAFVETQDYASALKDYEQALQRDPDNALIYSNRGNVYGLLNQPNKAIVEYNHALLKDPNHLNSYLNRGKLYFSLKQYQDAIRDFDQVLQRQPQHSIAAQLRSDASIYIRNSR